MKKYCPVPKNRSFNPIEKKSEDYVIFTVSEDNYRDILHRKFNCSFNKIDRITRISCISSLLYYVLIKYPLDDTITLMHAPKYAYAVHIIYFIPLTGYMKIPSPYCHRQDAYSILHLCTTFKQGV